MNISEENDIIKLKAMAYDQLVVANQAQHNISLLETRIKELIEQDTDKQKFIDSENC